MARFRNLLVHVYERVDDRGVVEILKTRLDDFDAFREQIARAALSRGGSPLFLAPARGLVGVWGRGGNGSSTPSAPFLLPRHALR
jgi:hypothetical protein